MNIDLFEISVEDLVNGFDDRGDDGAFSYDGRLDIRPPYQREFIYDMEKKTGVIDTILKGYPLNVMYWAVKDNGQFEIIDGQQRTLSICKYIDGEFSLNGLFYSNQPVDIQDKIKNYKLMVYKCEGTDSEKLAWFETINIAGIKLSDQELRNAVYAGSWVTDAKRYFSKTNCIAKIRGENYLSGEYRRQDYLETAIEWKIDSDNIQDIKTYMGLHQHDDSAEDLINYFTDVIDWVERIFPRYRSIMKGIPWGIFYNEHSLNANLDPIHLESEISRIISYEDVTRNKGVYDYLLNGNESSLSIRQFSDNDKLTKYTQQQGICPLCNNSFQIHEMHADHITRWSNGGRTTLDNCRMLCIDCHQAI